MAQPLPKHILQEQLAQLEREMKCLVEISTALNRSFDVKQLLNEVCSRVCSLMGYRATSIMLVSEEDRSVLTLRGYAGMDPSYVEQLNSRRAIRVDDPQLAAGPSGQAFLRGTPVAVTNIYREHHFQPWISMNPGFSALIALPLDFRGTRIGVMNCYSATPHEWSDHNRQLLTTIASQAAVAIGIVQFLNWQQEQMRQQQLLADQLKQQRDQLLQSRQIHDRLTSIVLTGGDIVRVTQTLSDLVGNPTAVVNDEGQVISAFGPSGDPLPLSTKGNPLGSNWRLPQRTEPQFDLRPVRLDPNPQAGISCTRVVAPVMAGEKRLGHVIVAETNSTLTDLDMAAVEYAGTVIALDRVHAQALFETEQRLRGDFLDELFGRQQISEEYILKRFGQLGYEPSAAYQVILIQVAEPKESESSGQADLARRRLLSMLQQLMSTHHRQSMVIHRNGVFTVLWPEQAEAGNKAPCKTGHDIASAAQEAIQALYPGRVVRIGIGRPYQVLNRLRDSFEEATAAMKVLQRLDSSLGILPFTDLGIYRVLLQTGSPDHLLDFCRDTLQPIRTHDAQWTSELELTLRTYLRCQMSTQRTAEELFVHPNTIMYRLKKLEQVCNTDLKNPQELLRFQLALMIQDIIR